MRYSVFTVSTPEYNVDETVSILKQLGYDGLEWRVSKPAPAVIPQPYDYSNRYWSFNKSTLDLDSILEIAPDIRQKCKESNLEILSLTTYLCPVEKEKIINVVKAADIMGCRNVRVNVPKYDFAIGYISLLNESIKNMKEVLSEVKDMGVRINFETHHGNITPSASSMYRFVSNFDPEDVGVIYDPGNMVHEGYENYEMGLEILGDYLAYIHVKNALWRQTYKYPLPTGEFGVGIDKLAGKLDSEWNIQWCPPDKGFVNFEKLAVALKKIGYSGYVSVEDFSNEKDTITKLIDNLKYLKNIFKEND
jgi:sugar phosphate isomerase/epimerase